MEIQYKKSNTESTFGSVLIGDVFKRQGVIYMKVRVVHDGTDWAVGLVTGQVVKFKDSEVVVVHKATLIVEAQ